MLLFTSFERKDHFSSYVTPLLTLVYQPSRVYPSLNTSGILMVLPSVTLIATTSEPPIELKSTTSNSSVVIVVDEVV